MSDERCWNCGGDAGYNWFDRSLCPCDDAMHTRCVACGVALDQCDFERPSRVADGTSASSAGPQEGPFPKSEEVA